jgi:nicotinamide phosphoribosyltransferase
MNSLLISDAYKQSHKVQYPKGTNLVYSNWTPRSDKHASTKNGVVVFGIQAFLKKITREFDKNFFSFPKNEVIESFKDGYLSYFGEEADTSHVENLHDLGYLPIRVKSLPEGSICPIGVPMLTIYNTIPEFYWITNFLETIMSTELWLPMTSATIAKEYKNILMEWSSKTCDNSEHVLFQAHDFSMRGMSGLEASMASGAGHLLSFVGSDTIPAVYYLKDFYNANPTEEMVGVSIPATEHSVMSMGTKHDELGTFKRLITEVYPKGLVSIVSDTWDLWKVLTDYLPALKEEVLARDGKVVIRPDSGDPADIICGNAWRVQGFTEGVLNKVGDNGVVYHYVNKKYYTVTYNENGEVFGVQIESTNDVAPVQKGVIELLWDTFGGTINEKGYKVLDSRIGAIYGDSITLERANDICSRLESKGFASSNIVFGVGSYTYQYNTRDTYGFAMKATYGEVEGVGRNIFKDPITDDGTKKSLKGLLRVDKVDDTFVVKDNRSWGEEEEGSLEVVFDNGKLTETSLSEIKSRLQ